MVVVERISHPKRTSFGLYLLEGKGRKHLGEVITVTQQYGLVTEKGRVLLIPASS